MTGEQLELLVRHRFGTGLRTFMKQKVEAERLHDYEIANLLNCNAALIRRARKTLGLRRDDFMRRFEIAHGAGAVETFRRIIQHPDSSLADVGAHFGFSREYARRAYRRILGEPYTALHRRKLTLRRESRRAKKERKSKQFASLADFWKKLASLGLPARLRRRGRLPAVSVRGQTVALRVATKPTLINRREYFRFNNSGRRNGEHDFYVCLCRRVGKRRVFRHPGGRHAQLHRVHPARCRPRAEQIRPVQGGLAPTRPAVHQVAVKRRPAGFGRSGASRRAVWCRPRARRRPGRTPPPGRGSPPAGAR